jgi:hypothetical protein
MRITKQIANDVALKLLEKKREVLKEKEKNISFRLRHMVEKHIPICVLDLSKKEPNYFTWSDNVSINGNGFNYKHFDLDKEVPSKHRFNTLFEPNETEAKELSSLINMFEKEKEEIKNLQKEIEITLFNLRTYNKVSENFPEALPFLPKGQNTSLSLNLSDLRNKLKQ